jgi:glycosyltransferase involved in cell wall biosynthesis
MRVLIVSSSSGSHGGGELYLTGLGQGLAGLGHDVETAMSDHPRMEELARRCAAYGRVSRLRYTNTYDRLLRCGGAALAAPTIARMAHHFRESGADVVHINKQNVEDGLDLLLAADRAGVPTVATVHIARGMAELGSLAGGIRDWVATRVLRRCRAHYITVARFCAEQLVACCKTLAPDRVHPVWNGVAPAPEASRAAVRAGWGCRDGDVVLGCVARLEAQKNPLFALDLLARLPGHVRLAWVGDGRLRADFERRVDELGLGDRVHLDGWRSDARQRMAGFDVFVIPSLYEGFPFAVLEAMAAGLPCVVSDADGTREALVDGETGWVCPPAELAAWAGPVEKLVHDAPLRERAGAAARRRWEAHFSLESMARGTAQVYEKVLAGGRVGAAPAGCAR